MAELTILCNKHEKELEGFRVDGHLSGMVVMHVGTCCKCEKEAFDEGYLKGFTDGEDKKMEDEGKPVKSCIRCSHYSLCKIRPESEKWMTDEFEEKLFKLYGEHCFSYCELETQKRK